MSFYAALGVKNDASTTEIRRAYQQLALTCHPDKVLGKVLHDVYIIGEEFSLPYDPIKSLEVDHTTI